MKTYKITVQVKSIRSCNAMILFIFKTFAVVAGSLFIEEVVNP